MSTLKSIAKELAPPIVFRALKRLVSASRSSAAIEGRERGADFYDMTFDQADHWKSHYTASHYYPLWTIVADRMRRRKAKILDIGCGPGQVACLMRDTPTVVSYCGLDFSEKRIQQARSVCPEYEFLQADVFKTDKLETLDYDTAFTMEFLEHIEKDKEVLQRLKSGTFLLATVPNFPAPGHVRYFQNANEVHGRYASVVDSLSVDTILANEQGKTFFLFEGYIP